MTAYPDTSYLCALYRLQENSPVAAGYFRDLPGPLEVTSLVLFEFRQSVRFQIRLWQQDRTRGIPRSQGRQMLTDLQGDLDVGALKVVPASWAQVHALAERLSSHHTETGGHRAMDILHVAAALELGATGFLTFDRNQRRLAEAEGLAVPVE